MNQLSQAPVAYTYKPSYSEAEIRKITVPSQPQANNLQDPIQKKPITKKGGGVWWSGKSS
jgi:hypothetical protein